MEFSIFISYISDMEKVRKGNSIRLIENGTEVGFISWSLDQGVMFLEHTFVDESQRGKGLAAVLMDEAVKVAKQENYKIRPVCSYSSVWFEKHPEEKELLD